MVAKTEENSKEWEQLEDHMDQILDLAEGLQKGDKIILVGPNASGKSLFRKLLNRGRKDKLTVVHASMQLRTESRPDMGAFSSLAHDWPEDATSQSTIRVLKKSIQSVKANCALHIDEPEIGFSEELQLGTGTWLRQKIEAIDPPPVMTIITTHSSAVASAFKDWRLIDLGFRFKTVEEWIKREIKPADPEAVENTARIMFSVIQTRINNGKNSGEPKSK